MKYSVIVPVYNAEKTIDRCLCSLLDQKYIDCEILLVNDGSTDCSAKLCKNYERKYSCVRYIEKENGGVSSARNAGLEVAKGEYVLFVDSDDYVSNNYFAALDQYDDVDLLVFRLAIVTGQKTQSYPISSALQKSEDFFDQLYLLVSTRYINGPYMKRFKRSIIEKNSLRFDENIVVAEDFVFCLAYTVCCHAIKVVDDVLYYNVDTAGSLCQRYKKDLYLQTPLAFNAAAAAIQAAGYSNAQEKALLQLVDWQFCQAFISGVMEEFKLPNISARHMIPQIYKMCGYFNSHNHNHYGYVNIWHFLLRFCIRLKTSVLFYYAVDFYRKHRNIRRGIKQ